MLRALLKSLAIAVAGMLLLGGGIYLMSRVAGLSAGEREALALIDAPPEVGQRNGFTALYTVDLDMPDEEREALLADDVARFAATPVPDGRANAAALSWRSGREDRPSLNRKHPDDPDWCSLRAGDCLTRVRADPDAYAAMLGRQAALLDRAEALSAYDHFASPFPPRLDTPLPGYQPLTWLLTRHTQRFAAGDSDGALAGTCAGIAQGRTLIAAGDSLIGSMIGAAQVRGHGDLLAAMLAELPRDHPLPPACVQAVARIPVQPALCRTMLAEARYMTAGLRQTDVNVAGQLSKTPLPDAFARLLFDPERTAGRSGQRLTWYCGGQAAALLVADEPVFNPSAPPSRWSLSCASNAIGCILADIAAPAYDDYGLRLQDADARLRTLSTLLWLRGQSGAMDAAALAGVPPALTSPARAFLIDVDAATLATPLYERARADSDPDGLWRIPLPASRFQPDAASP